MRTISRALVLCASIALPASAQQVARAEVLVLGTYHMANPERDLFNTQADDVLAAKRQAEIAEVIAILEKFNPTKIAIESAGDRRPREYAEYLAGRHELSRNEIEQIGFRLARTLGHTTIYAVDADGEFPHPRLVKYAQATGQTKEFDALNSEIGEMVRRSSAYLASHTILETLLYLNAEEKVAEDVGYYFRQAEFGEPWDWAGADLVADWFRRNMRIYANVTRLIDSPSERVLVVYGSGHLGWLQHAFRSNPTLRLRRLAEFAK